MTEKGKFDGLALNVDEPTKMVLNDPRTGAPLKDETGAEGFLMLLSIDSEPGKRFERKTTNDRLSRNRAQGRARKLSAEELEDEKIEQLVTLTTGWGLVSLDGKKLDVPFSAANARELYSSRGMAWVVDQAQAFLGDRANFSKA